MADEINWTTSFCGGGDCDVPPPDSILLIPPPPLPSFLQLAPSHLLQSNSSEDVQQQHHDELIPPCGGYCDGSLSPGVEFVELPRQGTAVLDDTWFMILVGSSVAVLLLGALLAFLVLKCRGSNGRKAHVDTNASGGGCRSAQTKYRNTNKPLAANISQPLGVGLGPGITANPCGHNPHVLWAAINHKGAPSHYAVPNVDYYRPPPGLGYYGALDPRFPTPPPQKSEPGTPDSQIYAEIPEIKGPEKFSTFDNSGFEDYMYEPIESFPLAEATPPTLRRGHSGTLSRLHGSRPFVGPPTHIESPNLPPLNLRTRNPLLV